MLRVVTKRCLTDLLSDLFLFPVAFGRQKGVKDYSSSTSLEILPSDDLRFLASLLEVDERAGLSRNDETIL